MRSILVTYATLAGSTGDVARAVGEEIAKHGLTVEVLPLSEVRSLEAYGGVVVGGPMIMGWHRAAIGFIRRHRREWQHIPLGVFVMGMSLTRTGETSVNGYPVYVDDKLPRPPENEGRLTLRERYARLSNYVGPILRAAHPARPVSLGVFGGRLEYGRLRWWAVLFAMVIIRAQAGDRRNWPAIRAWAGDLAAKLRAAADAAGESQPRLSPTP